MYQAHVDPPNDGNNLSFDGGDGKPDGSSNNTIVNASQCVPAAETTAAASLQQPPDVISHV
jgi:hypothetical protein